MTLKTIVENSLGPACDAADTQQFQLGRMFGWFTTPAGDNEAVWIVGLSADRNEARRIAREKRNELRERLKNSGVECATTNMAYSDQRSGFWVVGRPLLVQSAA